MKTIDQVLDFAHLLSLDIAAGALGSAALAASMLHARMPRVAWLLLPALIWIFFTLNKLSIARLIKPQAHRTRREFHQRHFAALAIVVVLLAWLLVLLARTRFTWTAIIAVSAALITATVIRLLLYRLKAWHMRVAFTAVLYSCAVWFGPYTRRAGHISNLHAASFVIHLWAVFFQWFLRGLAERATDLQLLRRIQGSTTAPEKVRDISIALSIAISVGILWFLKYALKSHLELSVITGYGYLLMLCVAPAIMVSLRSNHPEDRRHWLIAQWLFVCGVPLLYAGG